MKIFSFLIVVSCSFTSILSSSEGSDLFRAGNLRCEYLVSPLGIDAEAPRLSWMLDDSRFGAVQKAFRVAVGTDSAVVAGGMGDEWDTGRVDSDCIMVNYSGRSLEPFTRYFWSVELWDMNGEKSDPVVSFFETGMVKAENWKGSWISDSHGTDTREAPSFRKEFSVGKRVKAARAYIAAGGLYELYINGEKAGDHRLDPTYTRFDRRNLYVTYDITSMIKQGGNAIGVLLGNGWYNHQSTAVWYFDRAPWRNRPVFCMDLRIEFYDGSVETLSTDNTWKTSLSPVIFNSIYTAEHYDARLEQPGWNKPGFDDSSWESSVYRAAPSQNIVSQQLHPVRNVERIPPKSISRINDTTWVFDLGRNISGVSEFTVKADAGTVFRLKHGERIYPDGRVDISNIDVHYRPLDESDPFQTDIFIAGGNGTEVFMPRFNYKGFQYVEVTCSKPLELTAGSLMGFFMHSDVPPVGTIETSSDLINKIWKASNVSYLSNLFGYPTDCPQREKNGWTGDAHIAVETGLYNFDGITVYEKWLADHRDEQQPNGVLPAIIPTSGWGYHWANGPDWTSTIAIIPWNIYLFYGDSKLLSDCYDNIKRYVDRITEISPSGLTSWGLGDWVPVKSKAPVELTSSIYYFVDAAILSKAALLFGKEEDHLKYSSLAEKIRNAINGKYLSYENGIYGSGFQTELSMPLFWGIVPEEIRVKVASNLAVRVKSDNMHIDVGLLGTKSILNALSGNGYPDIAFTLASNETYPSWGWWIVNGATSFYENWPINATDDISMNHIMFGEINAWFYKALGGITPDPEEPGFKNVILKPFFADGLSFARTTHQSPYGLISSGWTRNKRRVNYEVNVPPNSSASFFVPSGFSLTKVQISSGVVPVDPERNSDGSLKLIPGRYNFDLRKD